MGKAAILLVLVSLYGWTISHSTQSRVELAREDEQARYQERVLAREQAQTGFGLVVNNAENDFQNYRDEESSSSYRGGSFSIQAIGVSGNKVTVSATGSVGRANYTIMGELESETVTPLSAVNIVGPASVSFAAGNTFLISGYDTNPGGSIGSGDAAPTFGVSTNDDASNMEAMQAGLDADQVTGKLTADTDGENSFDRGFDVDVLHDPINGLDARIAAYCADPTTSDNCKYYSGNQRFTGNDTFGSTEHPMIVTVDGNCEFKGNVKGYGVLRVKGEFSTVTGTPIWEGVVWASENGGLHELRGNPKIYGALILETTGDEMDFAIRGNTALVYSSEALNGIPVIKDLMLSSTQTEVQLKNVRQASDGAVSYTGLQPVVYND